MLSRNEADVLDASDPLARFRAAFAMPEPRGGRDVVYLCGNSLGLMPLAAADAVSAELDDWARLGVRGHFESQTPWLSYHRRARPGLAALTGAGENEVAAMNTLTVDLHLLMASFYCPDNGRCKVLIEKDAFPSDRFAVRSQMQWHGLDPDGCLIEWHGRDDDSYLDLADLDEILDLHGDEIALMLLPGVQYYSGQVLDIAALTARARRHGIVCGIDLAHAVGNVPLSLHDDGVDFAAFCTYKYLNSGPGSIAGVFVHERHLEDPSLTRLSGWWSHDESTRLKMSSTLQPEVGVDKWQISNPPILSLVPLIASLELFVDAGIGALRDKSLRLTAALLEILDTRFNGRIRTITPRNDSERGCQLSLVVDAPGVDPRAIARGLAERNVVCDWREPNVIRVAPAPLYNRFADLVEFADRLDDAFAGSCAKR